MDVDGLTGASRAPCKDFASAIDECAKLVRGVGYGLTPQYNTDDDFSDFLIGMLGLIPHSFGFLAWTA